MDKVIFLFLRRMRTPLLVLIGAYTVSGVGLLLIPGVDDQGEPWRMSIFHAFYFLSYTATTTGFGEVPYAFTDAQRMWVTFSIYLTIVAWLYAIGKILTLVQDPAFKQALSSQALDRAVRRMKDPFYIVCGHGDTGSMLVRAMVRRGRHGVVIDYDPDRINDLELADLTLHVPGLLGDASVSRHLKAAGLQHPLCQGVVALTDDEEANLKIAITSKLLNPELPVICRAHTRSTEDNMASFGTDHVINPFDAFGERLGLALYSPGLYLLREWLTSVPGAPLREPVYPPRGTWVLVGFGRFGKAVRRALVAHGLGTVVIEIDPARAGCDGPCVEGRGTEADTLKLAGIEQAVGLVAGTEQDTNNLSVIMTARDIKPDLFMVARQNHCDNQDLFDAARPSLVMRPSEMIVESILAHLGNPLLARFLELSLGRGESWANELLSRISGVTDDRVPEVWRVHVTAKGAPALHALIREGHSVTVGRLLEAGQARYAILNCVPLMLCREDGEDMLTPGDDILVKSGDRLLLCGRARAADHLYHLLRDHRALRYLVTGDNRPDGWIWRMLGMGRPEPAIGADRER